MFEGTAEQMWTSLSRLAALPDETRVYCAHEYTAASDLVGLVPLKLARPHSKALNLLLVDPPESRSPAAFEMVWRADQGSHPALEWLRALMRRAAEET